MTNFGHQAKEITEWAKGLTSYEKDNLLQLRAMPANFVTSRKQIASPSQPLLRVMRWNLWVAKPNVGFTEVIPKCLTLYAKSSRDLKASVSGKVHLNWDTILNIDNITLST